MTHTGLGQKSQAIECIRSFFVLERFLQPRKRRGKYGDDDCFLRTMYLDCLLGKAQTWEEIHSTLCFIAGDTLLSDVKAHVNTNEKESVWS